MEFPAGIPPILLGTDRLGSGTVPELAFCGKIYPNFLQEFHPCCYELTSDWVVGLCLNWLLGENLPKFLSEISPVLLGRDDRLGTGIIPDLALCGKTGPNFLWEFHQCCLELMLGWVLLVKFSGRYSTNITSY